MEYHWPMKDTRALIGLALILGLAFLGKKYLFPSEADLIQRQMDQLAQLVSKEKGENAIAVATKIRGALEFFVIPLHISLHDEKEKIERELTMEDKEKIKGTLATMKFRYSWVKVSFQDVRIQVRGEQAIVNTLIRLDFNSKQDGRVYDLYQGVLGWKKTAGKWLVNDVDLSAATPN